MLTENNNQSQLLVLVLPCDIKDDVVDTLMSLTFISGFNFSEIGGYSKRHSQYDVREQVQGYRKLLRFEILHNKDDQASILQSLESVCAKANVRYWISPINSDGHFSL